MRPAVYIPVGLAMAGLLTIGGCGKRGPLVYPDLLVPEAPQAVQLEQRGSNLLLSFNLPAKDRRGRPLQQPILMQVQRRELNPDERGECGECPKDYQPAMRIDPEFPAPAQKFGNRIVLQDADVRHGKRYQYRLVAVGGDGEAGVAAETMRTMLCSAPSTPRVHAKTLHGGVILLEMQGELPDNAELVGYAIYRAAGDEPLPFQPLTITPGTASYHDRDAQPGLRYRYAVRMVLKRWDEVLVSSDLSATVTSSLDDESR